jgi:hypothetical protein
MTRDITPQFNDPSTAAIYLGENVGTHYSAALRAAEAYGRYLAAQRQSLLSESYEGESLRDFWRELLRSEQVQIGSPKVLMGLGTKPSYYFSDFLDAADTAFRRRYQSSSPQRRTKQSKTEHAKCLRLLRNHGAEEMPDHFSVRNKIATWMQMLRITGGYQE